jgi:hypothetical protein
MRWSIEELIKYWKYYRENSVYYWFKNFFRNRKRRFKLFWRWVFTGYCKESLWNLDQYFTEMTLFRLKKFREMNKSGHPSTMSEEEWDEKLNSLIDKFEKLQSRYYETMILDSKLYTVPSKVKGFTSVKFHKQEDHELISRLCYTAQNKNNEEALKLFSELYFNLWD